VADLRWADLVVVMESTHRQRLKADHPDEMRYCSVHVLDIEDNYRFMDPELVEELHGAIDPILDAYA
jgi:predicted protein tyrosine phosphatase